MKSLDIIFPMFGPINDGPEGSQDLGDCIIVGVDKKYWFIIDSFNKTLGDGGYKSIKRAMAENNITKFEFMLITHWHNDHYGNAINMMNDGLVSKLYVQDAYKYPDGIPGSWGMPFSALKRNYDGHKNIADAKGIPLESAPTGNVNFHGANLFFHNNDERAIALHKNPAWVGEDYNNTSIGLLVSYLGRNFLTQGDGNMSMMTEYANQLPSNIDLLKSNHHSIVTMPQEFKKVNPRDAVITASKHAALYSAVRFNYQACLFDMGSNVYILGDQYEDIHITYKEDNSIEYNKRLTRAQSDNSSYLASKGGAHVHVDMNFTGESSGELSAPVKWITEAVKKAHSNNSKEIIVKIAPGDYSKDYKNYNFFHPALNNKAYTLQFLGLRGKVRFINTSDKPVILPPVYVSTSDFVTFENITFTTSPFIDDSVVNKMGSATNLAVTSGNVKCVNCIFIVDNSSILNRWTRESSYNIIHVDAFASSVRLENCTFRGKSKFGVRSAEGSKVNIIGNTTVDDSVETVYFATDGDITVNGNATKNTSNETLGGGSVTFQGVVTPSYRKTTRGQIIDTRLSTRFGGPQYFIADGNDNYVSVDHFNIHGNVETNPDFEGQFAYDKNNRSLSIAMGSTKDDWVRLMTERDRVSSKETSYKEWKEGNSYSYGQFIKASNGSLFVSLNPGTINYSSDIKLEEFNGRELDIYNVGGKRFMLVNENNQGAILHNTWHNKPENFPIPETNVEINKLGMFATYYTKKVFKNQPSTYGQLINLPCRIDNSNESMQIWIEQFSGQIMTRGGNTANPVADRKFIPVKPDFSSYDILFSGDISSAMSVGDSQLREAMGKYQYVSFLMHDGTNWVSNKPIDISYLRTLLDLDKKFKGRGVFKHGDNNEYNWLELNIENTLNSKDLSSIIVDMFGNIKAVIGFPRINNFD